MEEAKPKLNISTFKVRIYCLITSLLSIAILSAISFGITQPEVASLKQAQQSLGADLVIVPSGYPSHISLPIVVSERQANYLSDLSEQINKLPHVKAISPQIYIVTTQNSCCEPEVRFFGFDPATDFTIQPLLKTGKWSTLANYPQTREDLEKRFANYKQAADNNEVKDPVATVIIGGAKHQKVGETMKIYGMDFLVVGKLVLTNSDLDHAVFTDLATARQIAQYTRRGKEHPAYQDDKAVSVWLVNTDLTLPARKLQQDLTKLLPKNVYALGTTGAYYTSKAQIAKLVQIISAKQTLKLVIVAVALVLASLSGLLLVKKVHQH